VGKLRRRFPSATMSSLLAVPPLTEFSGSVMLRQVFTPDELAAARRGQEEFMLGRWNQEPDFDWPKPKAKQARSWKSPYSTWFRSELSARKITIGTPSGAAGKHAKLV